MKFLARAEINCAGARATLLFIPARKKRATSRPNLLGTAGDQRGWRNSKTCGSRKIRAGGRSLFPPRSIYRSQLSRASFDTNAYDRRNGDTVSSRVFASRFRLGPCSVSECALRQPFDPKFRFSRASVTWCKRRFNLGNRKGALKISLGTKQRGPGCLFSCTNGDFFFAWSRRYGTIRVFSLRESLIVAQYDLSAARRQYCNTLFGKYRFASRDVRAKETTPRRPHLRRLFSRARARANA